MTEQLQIPPTDTHLDGVDWSEYQRKKPTINRIRHSHYGISSVELTVEGRVYEVAVYTEALDLDEAETVCQNVPEWWDESMDTVYLYDVLGRVLWHQEVFACHDVYDNSKQPMD